MLADFYKKMVLIRKFEEKLNELSLKGLIFGTTHLYIGQEAVAVGVISALSKSDIVFSNHRSHGHFLAYCQDVLGLSLELLGKKDGVCAGRGGSQHLCKNNFYSNGILGNTVPVATGAALAEKLKNTNNIVAAFIGDGTLGQGVLYESLNFASLWNIPILFVLENNYYQQATHIKDAVRGDMQLRAKAFGIEGTEIFGNDVESVFNESKKAVQYIRKKNRPYWLICNTYRQCGHSRSDDLCYRSRQEENEWKKKDPIILLRKKITAKKAQEIEKDCAKIISKNFTEAMQAAFPSAESLNYGSHNLC